MKTVRRLFYVDIAGSVAFVALAFLSLFFFIDFVDELGDVGKRGYTTPAAALVSLLEIPGHIYELMPIAVADGRPLGNGKPGPLTRRLTEAFHALVRNEGQPLW